MFDTMFTHTYIFTFMLISHKSQSFGNLSKNIYTYVFFTYRYAQNLLLNMILQNGGM